jgi:hypothetical protein
VGIPVIAAVTTSAYDYSVSQDAGLGGKNQLSIDCIDWGRVFSAGSHGGLGAVEALASVPLGIPYLITYLATGNPPKEMNAIMLSYLGLDDEYLAYSSNPYYFAGNTGGNAGVFFASGATAYNGLRTASISISSQSANIQSGGTAALSLFPSLEGVTVTGINGGLTLAGTSGMSSSGLSMMTGNNGGGNQWRPLGVKDLPSSYKPPKGGPRKVIVKYGPYKGRFGWLDENGDIWVASKPGESHGGPHWDVQIDGGRSGHRNVYP